MLLQFAILQSEKCASCTYVFVTRFGHVYVFTDEGRLVRPLLTKAAFHSVLDGNKNESQYDIQQLLAENKLKYFDALESFTLDIALTPQDIKSNSSLLEIHANLMLGVTASCIPFIQSRENIHISYIFPSS